MFAEVALTGNYICHRVGQYAADQQASSLELGSTESLARARNGVKSVFFTKPMFSCSAGHVSDPLLLVFSRRWVEFFLGDLLIRSCLMTDGGCK